MATPWNETLSIGVPIIDQDHKTLLGLINDFEQLTAKGRHAMFEDAFKKVLSFAKEHFVREERIQRGIGFPEQASHAELHRQFGTQAAHLFVRLIGEKNIERRNAVGGEIAEFLNSWLVDHIQVQDTRMRPHVAARKPKAAPVATPSARPMGSGGTLPDLEAPAARPSSGWPDDALSAAASGPQRRDAKDWVKEMAAPTPVAKPAAPVFDLAAVLAAHTEWLSTSGAKGTRAVLGGQPVSGANLAKANLANADLRNADLSDADLTEANLGHADLRLAVLQNVRGNGASFALARMRHADLSRAQLENSVFRGADLAGAIFQDAKLTGADFKDALFLDTLLAGADLSGVSLSNQQLARAFRTKRAED